VNDFREVEPGIWSVLVGTRSYEVRVAGGEVRVNGHEVQVALEDPREWNPQAARSGVSGRVQVKSPMPGKIVRVLVAIGDEVEAGQGVVIVEAMKMQNELKSPRDGRVTAVAVAQNDTVNAGTVLVVIE
jgi:biotin carboxyl carrier protein